MQRSGFSANFDWKLQDCATFFARGDRQGAILQRQDAAPLFHLAQLTDGITAGIIATNQFGRNAHGVIAVDVALGHVVAGVVQNAVQVDELAPEKTHHRRARIGIQ